MKLSVIIVNYNVKYFLEQALVSAQKALQGIDGEIWVVDNNSVDGSVEMVRERFPAVRLISNKENTGFSKANNQAIRESNAEYILLLNPDTVVQEDSFRKVIAFMDEHPDAGGLGVKMIDGEGKFLPESKRGLPTPEVAFYKIFGLSKLFPKSKRFGRYHLTYLDKDQTHEVEVLAGAFMLLRNEALKKTGLLDETFFMYGEDIDLSYRITKAGYKNYYYPGTTIIHYKGESTRKSSVNYVFVFYKAMIIFARKHYSGGNAGILIFLINAAIYLRAFLAVAARFINRLAWPVADASLMFAGMYFIKNYWEVNHRFVLGGKYPPEYMYYHVPAYILFWIGGMWLSGAYEKRTPIRRVLRGILAGTIAIAVIYSFLPESLRFSRALIVLGAIWAALVTVAIRLIFNFARYRSLDVSDTRGLNIIIIGRPDEANRVHDLIRQAEIDAKVLGLVSPTEDLPQDERYLGTAAQVSEIASIYKVDEIIFCGKDISSHEIIDIMASTADKSVQYKIVPEESLYIIGSNSRNSSGELYTLEISLRLAQAQYKRIKRLSDLVVCLLMLPLFPYLLIFRNRKGGFIRNWFQVLLGRKTWVGYAGNPASETLPALSPGVLSPVELKIDDARTLQRLNMLYAKNYSWREDLDIILRQHRSLDR